MVIPHSRPTFTARDEEVFSRLACQRNLSPLEEVEALERDLARVLGFRHAVAVSSGTAALHLALAALGVGPGTTVAVPSYVCSSLLLAARECGAEVLVTDVSPEAFNMTPEALRAVGGADVVVLPHMFGLPADAQGIAAGCGTLVEDISLSVGAGVGKVGRAAVLSMYATKMLCAGEGGAVLTDEAALAEAVRDMRSYDEREELRRRFNYKISPLSAALARSQLAQLDEFIRARRAIAARYMRAFAGLPAGLPGDGPGSGGHVFYRFVLRVGDVDGFVAACAGEGVTCRRPVYRPLHRYLGLSDADFPGAAEAFARAVSVPIYPSLSDEEQRRVIAAVRRALEGSDG